jgi:AraC family transcriptional regulator
MEIGKAFDQLFGMLGSRGLIGPGMRMVAIFYDDPSAVPESQLRSRAGAVLGRSDGSLETTQIEGGPYAVLRHKGPYVDLKAAYQWLYGTWLVNSGREAGDAPVFEEYMNNPRDTPPTELLTDICLPLR